MKFAIDHCYLACPHGLRQKVLLTALAGVALGVSMAGLAQTAPPKPSGKADSGVICVIEPSLEVNLGVPVEGVLEFVRVDRGDVVSKGQLLARLNSSLEVVAVERQSEKAQFGARKMLRNKEMQEKNLISSQELDDISIEQKLAEHDLLERQEQLKLRSLVSPIRGVVVDRFKSQGDLVKQEKIFRIAQLDPLHVETVVPASFFGKVLMGQQIDVRPQFSSAPIKARVSAIDKVIDSASNTFRVRLLLPNPRFEIPAGQRCTIGF